MYNMNYVIHLPFREGCEDPLFKKSKWDKIDSLCSDDLYTLKYLRNRICAYTGFEWNLFGKDLVKLTIDENTTLDDIESRVNNLIYLLPHSYKVVSINKSAPKYNGDKLVGIDYDIELSISDIFCTKFNQYDLGLVCRAYKSEDFFMFFDEMGILYALPKSVDKSSNYSIYDDITVGDVILFNTKWDKQSSTVTLNETYDKIKDLEFKGTQTLYYNLHSTSKFIHGSFPEFVIYAGDITLAFSSPKESLLIEQSIADSVESFRWIDIFANSYEIKQYIDNLDIESIFDTYKIVISNKKIVNHYDQLYCTIVKTIDTDDCYLRSLFPLGETSNVCDYSYGDEIYTNFVDTKGIQANIQKAISSYSKFDHYNFLLEKKLNNQMDAIIIDDLVKKFWPLDYFKKLSENIPKRDVKAFINWHNNDLYAAFPDIMTKFCVL